MSKERLERYCPRVFMCELGFTFLGLAAGLWVGNTWVDLLPQLRPHAERAVFLTSLLGSLGGANIGKVIGFNSLRLSRS